MFLMLWVNDFWTLHSIPKWLKHAASGEDSLGFSDLIFPWFLFAIGLSIPFAFQSRLSKGETNFIGDSEIGSIKIKISSKEWYAKNIGLVKMERVEETDTDLFGTTKMVQILEKYKKN